MYTDSIEQLRGTAGARQVTVRVATVLAACDTGDHRLSAILLRP
jgi:hypothetical protein